MPGSELKFEHEIALRGVRYALRCARGRRGLRARADRPAASPRRDGVRGGRQRLRQDHADQAAARPVRAARRRGGNRRHPGRPPSARDDYRQLFTTVFSDFYLFEDLAAGPDEEQGEASMQVPAAGAPCPTWSASRIAHKVSLKNGAFTTHGPVDRPAQATGAGARLSRGPARCWCSTNGPPTRTRPSATCSIPSCCPELRAKGTCWW